MPRMIDRIAMTFVALGLAAASCQAATARAAPVVAPAASTPAQADPDAAVFARVSALAAQGDAGARLQLARMTIDGTGTPADKVRGRELLEAAAASGDAWSQFAAGMMLSSNKRGLDADLPAAMQWWSKAAAQYRIKVQQGDALGARVLSEMYARGEGVHVDPMLAVVYRDIGLRLKTGADDDFQDVPQIERAARDLTPAQADRVKAIVSSWQPGREIPADLRGATCPSPDYRQPGFDAAPATAEFQDFQARLRSAFDVAVTFDLDSFPDAPAAMARLHEIFGGVVAPGRKGDALLVSFVEPQPRGIVSPLIVMLRAIQDEACVVGDGGHFQDDGRDVELWYVDLMPGDAGPVQAFRGGHLPPKGVTERDVFPALIFVRDDRKRLVWYGTSREMQIIMQRGYELETQ